MVSKKEARVVAAWSAIGIAAATIVAGMAGADYLWQGVVAGVTAFAIGYYGMTHK